MNNIKKILLITFNDFYDYFRNVRISFLRNEDKVDSMKTLIKKYSNSVYKPYGILSAMGCVGYIDRDTKRSELLSFIKNVITEYHNQCHSLIVFDHLYGFSKEEVGSYFIETRNTTSNEKLKTYIENIMSDLNWK